MHPDDEIPTSGSPPSRAEATGGHSRRDGVDLDGRRRSQRLVSFKTIVSAFRRAAAAGQEEFTRACGAGPACGDGRMPGARERLVLSLPLDPQAPAAARSMVEGLAGEVSATVLDDALLVVSELV